MIDKDDGIWTISGDTHIGKWVRDAGRLDHDVWLFEKLDELLPYGGVCFDIGAYIGDHTEWYANRFDRVVAFEPNDVAFECLSHNMEQYDNVKCINAAVGTHSDGNYTMQCDKQNFGTNTLVPSSGGTVRFVQPADCGGLDFVKIDVEGFELDAIAAIDGLIKKYRPAMLIEQRAGDGNFDSLCAYLDDNGYEYSPIQKKVGKQCDLFCEPVESEETL